LLYQASQRDPLPTPRQALAQAWRHRGLILRLARTDLAVRLKGSILGWAWLAAGPLVMLVAYTFVFANVLKIGTASGSGDPGAYPLLIFSGLVLFQVFAELVLRAPNLLLDNTNYIKKVIFPVEILAWVALARASISGGVSLALLLAFYVVLRGTPPLTALLLPLLLALFAMTLLGIVWLLAAIGVFLRDLSHLLASLMPILMFASPVFYAMADVPEALRPLGYLNILAVFIEAARSLLFAGALPSWPLLAALATVPALLFWLGFVFFARNRARFADVV
jgi:lipopolysaccharide transport system permease protein